MQLVFLSQDDEGSDIYLCRVEERVGPDGRFGGHCQVAELGGG